MGRRSKSDQQLDFVVNELNKLVVDPNVGREGRLDALKQLAGIERDRMTVGPVKQERDDLNRKIEEIESQLQERDTRIAELEQQVTALESQLADLRVECNTAKATAQSRGEQLQSATFRLSDADTRQRQAESRAETATKELTEFKAGTAAFLSTLALDANSIESLLLKAEGTVPLECLMAAGLSQEKAAELLKTLAAAKIESSDRLIFALHLDGCKCRWAEEQMKLIPSQDEGRIFREVLRTRGVTGGDLQQRICLMQNEHNPNAAVYCPPIEFPAVISVAERNGELALPSPPPVSKSPLDCSRHWIDIDQMSKHDRYRAFVRDMEELWPDDDRSLTAFERLTQKGRARSVA